MSKGRLWKRPSVHRGPAGVDGGGGAILLGTLIESRILFYRDKLVGECERHVKGGFGNGQLSPFGSC